MDITDIKEVKDAIMKLLLDGFPYNSKMVKNKNGERYSENEIYVAALELKKEGFIDIIFHDHYTRKGDIRFITLNPECKTDYKL